MTDSPRWCDHCQGWGLHHTDRCPMKDFNGAEGVTLMMQTHVRLAIVGSTKFESDPVLGPDAEELIEELLDVYRPDCVVTGGAKGIDRMAERAARRRDIPPLVHKPKNPRWEPNGYKERNLKIAQDCTHLVAIRHPMSKTYGSGWTADRAEEMGKPVERITMEMP